MQKLLFLFLVFIVQQANAQKTIDVIHYTYEIGLTDNSDVITGRAEIKIKFLQPVSVFKLDLVNLKDTKGMQVYSVMENDKPLRFIHEKDKLEIRLHESANVNSVHKFVISYMGEPADGLIISSNKYNERTFFSDNWPNRAKNWIPAVDDPSDKASVEFIVLAPPHYNVVSNGVLVDEKLLSPIVKRTHWKEELPIPTKIMVIGVARFAVTRVDSSYKVPVTSWVYPQDSIKGAFDYSLADDILRYFEDLIGDYPYKKLANVQSKTIFGGMENANAIFYNENSVTGTGSSEALIAHEIAHQWFGNTVTEKNFHHLWLSEGFATYLTNMYIEHKYGRDSFLKRLDDEKQNVIRFANRSILPVVDSVSAYMDLLNANSYDKGGWILHMLREEIGDDDFKKLLKAFYSQYKFSNANSRDFQLLAEEISGKDLNWFFNQWLYRPGVPQLKIEMKIEGSEFRMRITQGENLYRLPFSFHIIEEDDEVIREKIWIEEKVTEFKITTTRPVRIAIDPDNNLLFETKK